MSSSVARAVAKRAAPFGLRMIAYDPFIQETLISDHGVLPATLSEVLSQSDFVSMHAPARPEVHHMLGETHFRQMKKNAIFINTGRGATVNEEALIKALQEGWIAHAALDVLEIDAASNRGIDEIRALREAVKFAPATMRMKIYIVDEAHMLTKEGANAFLKTLEEPPPHAVFILATTEPERLPPTVLSRCQRYAFRRIAVPVMIEKMREIATGEGIAVDDEALAAIAGHPAATAQVRAAVIEASASLSKTYAERVRRVAGN